MMPQFIAAVFQHSHKTLVCQPELILASVELLVGFGLGAAVSLLTLLDVLVSGVSVNVHIGAAARRVGTELHREASIRQVSLSVAG